MSELKPLTEKEIKELKQICRQEHYPKGAELELDFASCQELVPRLLAENEALKKQVADDAGPRSLWAAHFGQHKMLRMTEIEEEDLIHPEFKKT